METTEKNDNGPIPKCDESSNSLCQTCALCGCSTPAVRCDRCNSQIFCLSCDDMYHRHPKRKLHLRKAVDSIWNSSRSPRLRRRTDLPGDPSKIPIPPPRNKKRERHTICGRAILTSGLELGSFGSNRIFDKKVLSVPKSDLFAGHKMSPNFRDTTYENEAALQLASKENISTENNAYQHEDISKQLHVDKNKDGEDLHKNLLISAESNLSSPIQVSIPSNSSDAMTNEQHFGYRSYPHRVQHSQSTADLTAASSQIHFPHPYFPHPYPYMHPPMHPSVSHSMAHLNCAHCLSMSNLISPNSPYFHPMPWGSAHSTLFRRHASSDADGHLKRSFENLPMFTDSSYHYPPAASPFYPHNLPTIDPNFSKEMHQQTEMQKLKKGQISPKQSHKNEETSVLAKDETMEVQMIVSTESDAKMNSANNEEASEDIDKMHSIPAKPIAPWSCIHCTFINPPGTYICQVCCKTSYRSADVPFNQNEESDSIDRDSSSELINKDALTSTEISEFKETEKSNIDVTEEIQTPGELLNNLDEKKEELLENKISLTLTTETQTLVTTKSTDVQTQNLLCKSIASSTDSVFPKQECSVQTELENIIQNCSVATDPMISSQSMESLLSGVSAPPYHNRRAGWGRGGSSFSTQSLSAYERGRSRSPMPRSFSMYNETHSFGRGLNSPSEEQMHNWNHSWLMSDPMYYKPNSLHGFGQNLMKEDYFDGTWGSMDKLNYRVKCKQEKVKFDCFIKPKLHRSLDDLKSDKKPEFLHTQELQFLQIVKEAERCGFSLEDLHVAYLHCGRENPVFWLEDNWNSMIRNVISLAKKYGEDNEENDVGAISTLEAKEALRIHKGDIWDAVTECIENRQRKILELTVRGNFTQKQIAEALKNNDGNVELAYADLVRASSRRHKFILSPGLSEESEDLNLYNLSEDISVSSLKAGKYDSEESKAEKKKSDFLTKLSAIRKAQSERRKAREEKESFRENIVHDFAANIAIEKDSTNLPINESIEKLSVDDVQPLSQELPLDITPDDNLAQNESDAYFQVQDKLPTKTKPKDEDDTIPEDFDTNWVDSQGKWIEEYSDEQWDEETDGQWITLHKKYDKLDKELEDEARHMAALWEKEELDDDVFEEESKQNVELSHSIQSNQLEDYHKEKFEQWVKINLDKNLSDTEEGKENLDLEALTEVVLKENLEYDVPERLPSDEHLIDPNLNTSLSADWVNFQSNDIYLASRAKISAEELEMEKSKQKFEEFSRNKNSDDEWEKIEFNQQLQDTFEDQKYISTLQDELDSTGNPLLFIKDKSEIQSQDIEKINEKSETQYINDQVKQDGNYKQVEFTQPDISNNAFLDEKDSYVPELIPAENVNTNSLPSKPVIPLRRKSKLNNADVENTLAKEISGDKDEIPPALPAKIRASKSPIAVHDSPTLEIEISQELDHFISEDSIVEKPKENEILLSTRTLSKDTSPVTSLSNESDSNFFADSESEIEIKASNKQKSIHKKTTKIESYPDCPQDNSSFDKIVDYELKEKLDKNPLSKQSFCEESSWVAHEEDINYELPILSDIRGTGALEVGDGVKSKAFRDGTTRPLQLFKPIQMNDSPTTINQVSSDLKDNIEITIKSKTEMLEVEKDIVYPDSKAKVVSENDLPENKADKFAISPNVEELIYNQDINTTAEENQNVILSESLLQDVVINKDVITTEIKSSSEKLPFIDEINSQEAEEIAFTEMEGMSAAVDYFFGRYNEIVIAKPKKKAPLIKGNQITKSPNINPMSSSETSIVSEKKIPTLEKSELISQDANITKTQNSNLVDNSKQNQTEIYPLVSDQLMAINTDVKEAPSSEYLSFAEDYFFGSYNEVVVQKPGKKKAIFSPPKAKLSDSAFLSDTKTYAQPQSSTIIKETSETENIIQPELTKNYEDKPKFAQRKETVAIDCDHFQIPLEANELETSKNITIQEQTDFTIASQQEFNKFDSECSEFKEIKNKTVHFEESETPVIPPPRKNKLHGQAKLKSEVRQTELGMSTADEYLFGKYAEIPSLKSMAKKKLSLHSEDFKMKSEFEPHYIPFGALSQSDEAMERFLASEISTPLILDNIQENFNMLSINQNVPLPEGEDSNQISTSLDQCGLSLIKNMPSDVKCFQVESNFNDKISLNPKDMSPTHDSIQTSFQCPSSKNIKENSFAVLIDDKLENKIHSFILNDDLESIQTDINLQKHDTKGFKHCKDKSFDQTHKISSNNAILDTTQISNIHDNICKKMEEKHMTSDEYMECFVCDDSDHFKEISSDIDFITIEESKLKNENIHDCNKEDNFNQKEDFEKEITLNVEVNDAHVSNKSYENYKQIVEQPQALNEYEESSLQENEQYNAINSSEMNFIAIRNDNNFTKINGSLVSKNNDKILLDSQLNKDFQKEISIIAGLLEKNDVSHINNVAEGKLEKKDESLDEKGQRFFDKEEQNNNDIFSMNHENEIKKNKEVNIFETEDKNLKTLQMKNLSLENKNDEQELSNVIDIHHISSQDIKNLNDSRTIVQENISIISNYNKDNNHKEKNSYDDKIELECDGPQFNNLQNIKNSISEISEDNDLSDDSIITSTHSSLITEIALSLESEIHDIKSELSDLKITDHVEPLDLDEIKDIVTDEFSNDLNIFSESLDQCKTNDINNFQDTSQDELFSNNSESFLLQEKKEICFEKEEDFLNSSLDISHFELKKNDEQAHKETNDIQVSYDATAFTQSNDELIKKLNETKTLNIKDKLTPSNISSEDNLPSNEFSSEESIDNTCPCLMSHFYDEWIETVKLKNEYNNKENYFLHDESSLSDFDVEVNNESISEQNELLCDLNGYKLRNENILYDQKLPNQAIKETIHHIDSNYMTPENIKMHVNHSLESLSDESFVRGTLSTLPFRTQITPTLSKYCQTEDEFEEDQYFDSFDYDISLLYPKTFHDELIEHGKIDIGIQCSIVNNEDKTFIKESTEAFPPLDLSDSKILLNDKYTSEQNVFLKNHLEQILPITLTIEQKINAQLIKNEEEIETSSCESLESNSDHFLESYSSYDEMRPFSSNEKLKIIHGEIDSDTGFSSGSDSGGMHKYKKLALNKTVAVENLKQKPQNFISSDKENISLSLEKTSKERLFTQEISDDSKISDSNRKQVSDVTQNEVKCTSENILSEEYKRAITPISVEQLPSIEDSVTFIELDEQSESKSFVEEIPFFHPTIEYFYGPLPESLCITLQNQLDDQYFNALDNSLQLTEFHQEDNYIQIDKSNSTNNSDIKDENDIFIDASPSINTDATSIKYALNCYEDNDDNVILQDTDISDKFLDASNETFFKEPITEIKSNFYDVSQTNNLSFNESLQTKDSNHISSYEENEKFTDNISEYFMPSDINRACLGLEKHLSSFEGDSQISSEAEILNESISEYFPTFETKHANIEFKTNSHAHKMSKELCDLNISHDEPSCIQSKIKDGNSSEPNLNLNKITYFSKELPAISRPHSELEPTSQSNLNENTDSLSFTADFISIPDMSMLKSNLEYQGNEKNISSSDQNEILNKNSSEIINVNGLVSKDKIFDCLSSKSFDEILHQNEKSSESLSYASEMKQNTSEGFYSAQSTESAVEHKLSDKSLTNSKSFSPEIQEEKFNHDILQIEERKSKISLPLELTFEAKIDILPKAIVENDDVTDISTHFTMTEESDKISDIESDNSLKNVDDVSLSASDISYETVSNTNDHATKASAEFHIVSNAQLSNKDELFSFTNNQLVESNFENSNLLQNSQTTIKEQSCENMEEYICGIDIKTLNTGAKAVNDNELSPFVFEEKDATNLSTENPDFMPCTLSKCNKNNDKDLVVDKSEPFIDNKKESNKKELISASFDLIHDTLQKDKVDVSKLSTDTNNDKLSSICLESNYLSSENETTNVIEEFNLPSLGNETLGFVKEKVVVAIKKAIEFTTHFLKDDSVNQDAPTHEYDSFDFRKNVSSFPSMNMCDNNEFNSRDDLFMEYNKINSSITNQGNENLSLKQQVDESISNDDISFIKHSNAKEDNINERNKLIDEKITLYESQISSVSLVKENANENLNFVSNDKFRDIDFNNSTIKKDNVSLCNTNVDVSKTMENNFPSIKPLNDSIIKTSNKSNIQFDNNESSNEASRLLNIWEKEIHVQNEHATMGQINSFLFSQEENKQSEFIPFKDYIGEIETSLDSVISHKNKEINDEVVSQAKSIEIAKINDEDISQANSNEIAKINDKDISQTKSIEITKINDEDISQAKSIEIVKINDEDISQAKSIEIAKINDENKSLSSSAFNEELSQNLIYHSSNFSQCSQTEDSQSNKSIKNSSPLLSKTKSDNQIEKDIDDASTCYTHTYDYLDALSYLSLSNNSYKVSDVEGDNTLDNISENNLSFSLEQPLKDTEYVQDLSKNLYNESNINDFPEEESSEIFISSNDSHYSNNENQNVQQFNLDKSIDGSPAISTSFSIISERSETNGTVSKKGNQELFSEHFAIIHSLNENLSVADSFFSFDLHTNNQKQIDSAVAKTHDDDITDISSYFDKTDESELWLEAETDNSLDEFEEDEGKFSLKEGKINETICFLPLHNIKTYDSLSLSQIQTDLNFASIETIKEPITGSDVSNDSPDKFSFDGCFSGADNSSDTCADAEILLQETITEESDKWSNIEDDFIDEAIYGHKWHISESKQVLDLETKSTNNDFNTLDNDKNITKDITRKSDTQYIQDKINDKFEIVSYNDSLEFSPDFLNANQQYAQSIFKEISKGDVVLNENLCEFTNDTNTTSDYNNLSSQSESKISGPDFFDNTENKTFDLNYNINSNEKSAFFQLESNKEENISVDDSSEKINPRRSGNKECENFTNKTFDFKIGSIFAQIKNDDKHDEHTKSQTYLIHSSLVSTSEDEDFTDVTSMSISSDKSEEYLDLVEDSSLDANKISVNLTSSETSDENLINPINVSIKKDLGKEETPFCLNLNKTNEQDDISIENINQDSIKIVSKNEYEINDESFNIKLSKSVISENSDKFLSINLDRCCSTSCLTSQELKNDIDNIVYKNDIERFTSKENDIKENIDNQSIIFNKSSDMGMSQISNYEKQIENLNKTLPNIEGSSIIDSSDVILDEFYPYPYTKSITSQDVNEIFTSCQVDIKENNNCGSKEIDDQQSDKSSPADESISQNKIETIISDKIDMKPNIQNEAKESDQILERKLLQSFSLENALEKSDSLSIVENNICADSSFISSHYSQNSSTFEGTFFKDSKDTGLDKSDLKKNVIDHHNIINQSLDLKLPQTSCEKDVKNSTKSSFIDFSYSTSLPSQVSDESLDSENGDSCQFNHSLDIKSSVSSTNVNDLNKTCKTSTIIEDNNYSNSLYIAPQDIDRCSNIENFINEETKDNSILHKTDFKDFKVNSKQIDNICISADLSDIASEKYSFNEEISKDTSEIFISNINKKENSFDKSNEIEHLGPKLQKSSCLKSELVKLNESLSFSTPNIYADSLSVVSQESKCNSTLEHSISNDSDENVFLDKTNAKESFDLKLSSFSENDLEKPNKSQLFVQDNSVLVQDEIHQDFQNFSDIKSISKNIIHDHALDEIAISPLHLINYPSEDNKLPCTNKEIKLTQESVNYQSEVIEEYENSDLTKCINLEKDLEISNEFSTKKCQGSIIDSSFLKFKDSVIVSENLEDRISQVTIKDHENELLQKSFDKNHFFPTEMEKPELEVSSDRKRNSKELFDSCLEKFSTDEFNHTSDLNKDLIDDPKKCNHFNSYDNILLKESFSKENNFLCHNIDAHEAIPDAIISNYDEAYETNLDEFNYPKSEYPLYDEWIEKSFDLKDYGVESTLSENEMDAYQYDINNDANDEDIQRAIELNITNFEELDKNDPSLTESNESYKSLSSQIQKDIEHSENWLTDDFVLITEDAHGHTDDLITKIDELLAEDELDFEDYFCKDDRNNKYEEELEDSTKICIPESFDTSVASRLSPHHTRDFCDNPNLSASFHFASNSKSLHTHKENEDKNSSSEEKIHVMQEHIIHPCDEISHIPLEDISVDLSINSLGNRSFASDQLNVNKMDEISFLNQNQNIGHKESNTKDITMITPTSFEESSILFMRDNQEDDLHLSHINSPSSARHPCDSESNHSLKLENKLLDNLTSEKQVNIKVPDLPPKLKQNKSSNSLSSQDSDSASILDKSQSCTFFSQEPEIPPKLKHKSSNSSLLMQDCESTSLLDKSQSCIFSLQEPVIPPKLRRKSSTGSLSSQECDLPSKLERKSSSSSLSQEFDLPPKLLRRKSLSNSLSSNDSLSFTSLTSVKDISDISSKEFVTNLNEKEEFLRSKSRSPSIDSIKEKNNCHSSSESLESSQRIKNESLSIKRSSIDECILKLQQEGKCTDRDKAFIAAKLIEMQFEKEDALLASKQCNSVYHAVKFLTQLCELCNCRFPINQMNSMVHCTHRACKNCFKAHFSSLIYDRSIFTLLCPICHQPDITDQNMQEYFNHLDMMLRNILENHVYDLFQRKLRDEVLTKDPNFHWCSQCSSGFIASPRLKKLYCPDCSAITCALCHQTWELEHEGVHCERFQQWKDMHTPEPPPAGLVKKLTDRGICCPSCNIVYPQACGGCLIYRCSHCEHEFCGFCLKPCKRGKDCKKEISCESRGVHIHHLYNCLFFIRDFPLADLQMLLDDESISYLTIPPRDQIVKTRCQVREQKHSHGNVFEDRCGRNIEPYCAGLCRIHYFEYLAELISTHKINPLPAMPIDALQNMLRKARIFIPERIKGETNNEYHSRLKKEILDRLS